MNIPVLKSEYSKINNLLYLSYIPKVINAAIDIKLFDLLAEKPRTTEEISQQIGGNTSLFSALLDVLVEIDLIDMQEGKYALTDLSKEYLFSGSATSQVGQVKHFDGSSGPVDNLLPALKGETPDFDGKMWSTKEAMLEMEQGMKAGALLSVVEFIKTIPEFSKCTKMCDFAGNIGYFSYALLDLNQNLSAHVYDLPEVCEIAKQVKQNEKDFARVSYHDFDAKEDDDFGNGYDFFFSSHFLYEMGATGELTEFLKKVNKSMTLGGIFVSNHVSDRALEKDSRLTMALVELQTRAIGYPSHQLPEKVLKSALEEAGFGEIKTSGPDSRYTYPTLLLSAKKISEN